MKRLSPSSLILSLTLPCLYHSLSLSSALLFASSVSPYNHLSLSLIISFLFFSRSPALLSLFNFLLSVPLSAHPPLSFHFFSILLLSVHLFSIYVIRGSFISDSLMHLCLLFPPYFCPAPSLLSPPPPSLSSALYSLPVHLVSGPHQPDSRYISHISNRSLCASFYLLGDQQPSPCVDPMSSKELLNFSLCPLSVCPYLHL